MFRAFMQPLHFLKDDLLSLPVSSQKPFPSVFQCSARNTFILMLLIHTPDVCCCMYVDAYSGLKCGVFINQTQNVHTRRPPNALPSSTQSHYSTTVQQNISAVSYSLQVAANFGWWRHRSLLFLILSFLILSTSFICISYTGFLGFRWRPSLKLLLAFF